MAGTYRSSNSSVRVAGKIQSAGGNVATSKGRKKSAKERTESQIKIAKEKGKQARATAKAKGKEQRKTIESKSKAKVTVTREVGRVKRSIIRTEEKEKAKSKLAGSTASKQVRKVKSQNAVKRTNSGIKKRVTARKKW